MATFGWDPLLGRCETWCDAPCGALKHPFRDCAGCEGSGYRCRADRFASWFNASSFATVGEWSRGYCGTWNGRKDTRAGDEGDCKLGERGSWAAPSELRGDEAALRRWCLRQCAACSRCAVASVSSTDCAWHSTCTRPLQLSRHGISYHSRRVRRERPPRNCSVASFPSEVGCSTPKMAAWYFGAEKQCGVAPGLATDLYQFGVPASMPQLARLVTDRLAPAYMYHSYWGFDSFLGLPEEDARALRPTEHLWGKGQFSMVHSFMQAAGAKRDAHGAEVYHVRPNKPLPTVDFMRKFTAREFGKAHRVRLVAGFYNETLTARLAKQAYPARFAEFDCDLWISTIQALRWMATHQLLVPGSLVACAPPSPGPAPGGSLEPRNGRARRARMCADLDACVLLCAELARSQTTTGLRRPFCAAASRWRTGTRRSSLASSGSCWRPPLSSRRFISSRKGASYAARCSSASWRWAARRRAAASRRDSLSARVGRGRRRRRARSCECRCPNACTKRRRCCS